MSEERAQELYERLREGVINYDEDDVAAAAQLVLDEGIDAFTAVFKGLIPGMEEVGELYEQQEYFVPELLMCADAMYAGLNILRPHMDGKDMGVSGVVVMGVVQGDVHDIGKNIVKMMFDVAGFEVHDLGRDVPLETFVEEQLNTNADLVCLSAMMTTTMVGMKDIIKQIKEKNPNARILIGGAPVTEEIADKFGADGFAEDASNALKDAINMLSTLKSIQEEAEQNK
ncbi:corrinoid protein [Candidatus Contubernalis alkaliaceticus]|uniref:corrinoid protein n=1 Tax=Candidatus Contubernalis alkaliaceticus TaxID=338645 RepID=UPI001F4BF099|nr:corrinoid protein [Candidatus Contubernalis alkalaceticus]UNC91574.1 corrinoid protein [Candidatus Contubernalis alkalaceticus]